MAREVDRRKCKASPVKGAILVVEDEQAIADLVRAYLKRDGFGVVWASSGEAALEELSRHPVRLVVLDIGLPGIDGFEVCRRLRARTGVPILILSARDDEVDRVAGLEAGADDYVVKPFSPRELVARVKAILRRAGGGDGTLEDAVLSVGEVELDRAARTVSVDGGPVELTGREFDLLAALLAHPGVVLSRDRLLELAWGESSPAAPARSTSTSPSCAPSSAVPTWCERCAAPATRWWRDGADLDHARGESRSDALAAGATVPGDPRGRAARGGSLAGARHRADAECGRRNPAQRGGSAPPDPTAARGAPSAPTAAG